MSVAFKEYLLPGAVGVGAVGLLFVMWKYFGRQQKPVAYPNLKGKVAIVTGGNTGIGFETALEFASRDARVIVASRNVSKGEKAVAEIRQRTGNGNVLFKQLDLASLGSVRKFAALVTEEETKLDILVNNAGIIESNGAKTEDGFEMIFGVNHLGHFLLTNLLTDLLKKAPSARIVNVSSYVQRFDGRFDFDMVNKYDTKQVGPMSMTYVQSKVANVLFTQGLAKRLKGSNVTANALHPGFVNTQMSAQLKTHVPAWRRILTNVIIRFFFKSPRQGAQTSIHCALSKDLEGVSGKFFSDCKEIVLTSEGFTSEEDADRLWEISTSLVNSVKEL